MTYDEVLRDIVERDRRDTTRAVAPLVPATDAIVVDSTGRTIEQVVDDRPNRYFAASRMRFAQSARQFVVEQLRVPLNAEDPQRRPQRFDDTVRRTGEHRMSSPSRDRLVVRVHARRSVRKDRSERCRAR